MELIILAIILGLVIFLLFFGSPLKVIKFIGQGFVKLIIGALMLFLLNLIGVHFNIHIPINFVTTAISGLLGIPGILALVAIDQWIL